MGLTVTLFSAIAGGEAAVLVLRKLRQKDFLFDFLVNSRPVLDAQ